MTLKSCESNYDKGKAQKLIFEIKRSDNNVTTTVIFVDKEICVYHGYKKRKKIISQV